MAHNSIPCLPCAVVAAKQVDANWTMVDATNLLNGVCDQCLKDLVGDLLLCCDRRSTLAADRCMAHSMDARVNAARMLQYAAQ